MIVLNAGINLKTDANTKARVGKIKLKLESFKTNIVKNNVKIKIVITSKNNLGIAEIKDDLNLFNSIPKTFFFYNS